MPLDPRDTILQNLCPTVMVPRFTPLAPLHGPGHRFLAAADGLWLEVQRPWLRLVWPLCSQTDVKMPYGEVQQTIELAFDRVPEHFIRRFIDDAKEEHPNECGAWLVWNEQMERLEYRKLCSVSATCASLEVDRPALLSHEHLAVDLHSHGGELSAFFSPEDDRDDVGEVKVSIVIGNVKSDGITVEMRLCALELLIPF